MTTSLRIRLVVVCLVTAGVGGCSSAPVGPKTVPAKGKVTYKKLPVEGATVSFLGDGKIAPAIAITDAAGEFILTTTRSGDGAVPGNHKVTVSKIITPPGASKAKSGNMTMEDAAKAAAEPASPKALNMLPEGYADAKTSSLSFTVKAGDKNDFLIELTD